MLVKSSRGVTKWRVTKLTTARVTHFFPSYDPITVKTAISDEIQALPG